MSLIINTSLTGLRILVFLLLSLLLVSCGTTGSISSKPDKTPSAEQAYSTGQFEDAALEWQRRASDSTEPESSTYRIRAADAWIQSGNSQKARDQLRWVERTNLDRADRSRLNLVLADLALSDLRPNEANDLLEKAEPDLPRDARSRYSSLKSKVQAALNSPVSRDIANAANLIRNMRYYDPTRTLQIVQSLESVSSGELAIRAENPRGDPQFIGWMDLVLVIRSNLVQPESVATEIQRWKLRHPSHLLSEKQALDSWLIYRQQFAPPGRIAVVLPDSGRFESAGQAIRDGLMSAYTQNSSGSELLFFSTNDSEDSAIAAYFSALDAGADLIIGPLRKESIEAMLTLAGMTTPVLALNELPDSYIAPPGLAGQMAGISLSQEHEVTRIAQRAAADGYQQAMLLAPEDAWGDRMALAFEDEFLQADRQIVSAVRYNSEENDHSSLLERLLKLDESEARKRSLENTLGQTLEFQAMRRTDIDMIFLAASAEQARLIRPQLRFLDAGDIPVYATGRVYSGRPNASANQDLNGLRIPITPWQEQNDTPESLPEIESIKAGSLANLFALGRDTWNILPWLPLMRKDPDFQFSGDSGHYRFGRSETLDREPEWAEFVGGRPQKLN